MSNLLTLQVDDRLAITSEEFVICHTCNLSLLGEDGHWERLYRFNLLLSTNYVKL